MQSTDGQRKRSGWRILIAGTGGQGVLTAARLLCDFFTERGHYVVSGQLHGMAQRGGSVQSSVLIDCGISPMIADGRADFVVGYEPAETARALPYMSSRTVVYMNTTPVIPYVLGQRFVLKKAGADYPDVDRLIQSVHAVVPNTFALDATALAVQAGSAKTLNMVMLGFLLGSGSLPYAADTFWNEVVRKMPPALAGPNTRAFSSGVKRCREFQCTGVRP